MYFLPISVDSSRYRWMWSKYNHGTHVWDLSEIANEKKKRVEIKYLVKSKITSSTRMASCIRLAVYGIRKLNIQRHMRKSGRERIRERSELQRIRVRKKRIMGNKWMKDFDIQLCDTFKCDSVERNRRHRRSSERQDRVVATLSIRTESKKRKCKKRKCVT